MNNESKLDKELRAHVAQQVEEYVATGMSREEAERRARLDFGGVEQVKEECREARSTAWLSEIARDLRYGLRTLRKNPGFTAVAVLSIALGIGANTTMFSVIDVLMLRDLPVRNPGQLVSFFESSPDANRPGEIVTSYQRIKNWAALTRVFSDVAGVCLIDRSNVQVDGNVGQARVALVTGNYFPMLGVGAFLGRPLTPDDDRVPGGHPVAMISYSYWKSSFSGNGSVLGKTVTLNGAAYAIVGVAPQSFTGDWVGRPADFWIPAMQQAQAMPEFPTALSKNGSWLRTLARLRPGVTIAEAQAAAQIVHQGHYLETWPHPTPQQAQFMAHSQLLLRSAAAGFSGQRDAYAQSLSILTIVVGLILMIACVNVANLLLARSAARQREMAVRLAIGAGRARILRQLLTESVLLAGIGGSVGLLFSLWGTKALANAVASGPVPTDARLASSWLSFDLHPDWRVFAFTAGACMIAGILFGLAPALRSMRTSLSPALAGRGAPMGSGRLNAGKMLAIPQVATSLLLLIGAGLFLRTLYNLKSQNLGIDRQHLLLVWTAPGQTGRQSAALASLARTVQERLASLPGVVSAGFANKGFLESWEGGGLSEFIKIPGKPPKPGLLMMRVAASPKFFETAGMPLLRGRDFTERDTQEAPQVMILNEAAATFLFGSEDPIGKRFAIPGDNGYPYEIIGVVANAKLGTPQDRRGVEYVPYRQIPNLMRTMCVEVRTSGNPSGMSARVREELRSIDPNLPVLKIDTVEEQLNDVLTQERLIANVSAGFGALALLLASLGLYGVVSYSVSRRTSEIGVRMALGATSGGVLGMVFRETMTLAVAGIALGTTAAFALTRLIASRLFGVAPADLFTFSAAILVIISVAALAGFVPARRASRVEPVEALRYE